MVLKDGNFTGHTRAVLNLDVLFQRIGAASIASWLHHLMEVMQGLQAKSSCVEGEPRSID